MEIKIEDDNCKVCGKRLSVTPSDNDTEDICNTCLSALQSDYSEVFGEDAVINTQKVVWREIVTEPLQCGDFWASYNPNTPEKQGNPNYNLQMQAITPQAYGIVPNSGNPVTNLGNGAYWRPVAVTNQKVPVFSSSLSSEDEFSTAADIIKSIEYLKDYLGKT